MHDQHPLRLLVRWALTVLPAELDAAGARGCQLVSHRLTGVSWTAPFLWGFRNRSDVASRHDGRKVPVPLSGKPVKAQWQPVFVLEDEPLIALDIIEGLKRRGSVRLHGALFAQCPCPR